MPGATLGAAAPDDEHVTAWFDAPPPQEVAGVGDDTRQLRRRLLRSEARCVHVDRVASWLTDAGFDIERPLPPNAVGGAVEVREGRAHARVVVTWVWVPGSDHRSWLASTAAVHRRGRRGAAAAALAGTLRPHLHAALDADPDVAWVRWLTDDEARATEL